MTKSGSWLLLSSMALLVGCTNGSTPNCASVDAGCGSGFDGNVGDVGVDASRSVDANDAAFIPSDGGTPEAAAESGVPDAAGSSMDAPKG